MTRYHRVRDATGRPRLAERREGVYRAASVPSRLERLEGRVFEATRPGERLGDEKEVDLLAPTEPSKIVCIGRNYRRHAEELGNPVPDEPLIFLKPPSSIVPDGGVIRLPESSQEVHHEAELACVVGEPATDVPEASALDVLAGYTCANDVTARDLQRADKTFTRAKGFDTFCPVGPGLVSAEEFEPAEHRIECRVDGEKRQSSPLDDFIFPVAEVVAYVSAIMTLEPGDLLLTGTPAGVGPLEPGCTVEVAVDGIGSLANPVAER